jgi:hypothetical protein
VTGNEGVTDIFFLLGRDSTAATVIVKNSGYGYRIKAKILKKEFEAGGPLQQLLLRFSQALLRQTEQTAVEACQSVKQKLCRFFLMILDRLATVYSAAVSSWIHSRDPVFRPIVRHLTSKINS